MSAYEPHRKHVPVLQEVGADYMATSQDPVHIHSQLVPAPSPAAASAAVTFVDDDGVEIEFADNAYVVIAQSEGQAGTVVDESTKTTTGCTIVAGGNFSNPINVVVIGRKATQPKKDGTL